MLGPFYVGDCPAAALEIAATRNDVAVDLSAYDTVTISVLDPDGVEIDWDADATLGTSTITVPFPATTPFDIAGTYTMILTLSASSSGATETVSPVEIDVLALGAADTWSTIGKVQKLTGVTVTSSQLRQAQGVVELFSGTTTAASDDGSISSRNLRLLERAVGYQAVFVKSHPDLFTGVDVEGVSQDGLSAQYNNIDARLLAPLANRCIKRLSWKTRGIKARLPRSSDLVDTGNRDSAAHDDFVDWDPL